ncbi:efflux RND transporter periplasmic adaptor subunit [uncultured Rikenella sp.]|uniref:HlyD family secretion protein n=1 Tax=uncultured Rikenella sp. TaxID=368003 RepID=UPI00260AEB3C|nr:efflux RND transporter periplasmic adaptor subunit [uncultured Rikenella sp.]
MKSKVYTITLIIIAVITVVAFIGWFVLKPAPYLMQGTVEATSYKVSSKVPGRVDSLTVKRGDTVRKGQFLYGISSPEVYAKLTQAEAAKSAATAMQDKVDAGARKQQIRQAYEMWQQSLAGLELAQKTYDRVKNLYDQGVVPAQKLDEAQAALKAMKTTAAAAEAGYNMATEGAQWEEKAAAKALVEQAGGAVSEVESYVTETRQYAPVDGEVSSVVSENGELVGTGYPVVTVVDLSDAWVVFNIKETLLPKIRRGTKFDGYFPALDKTYELTVDYIAAEASYATWAATRTSGEFDVKTFEVHARPAGRIDGLRPGMTVTVDYNSF